MRMNFADGLIKSDDLADALPCAARTVQVAKQLAKAHPDDPDFAGAVQLGLGVAKRAGLVSPTKRGDALLADGWDRLFSSSAAAAILA
jgi:hypothetical protein